MTTAIWRDRQAREFRVQYDAYEIASDGFFNIRYRCDLFDVDAPFYATLEEAQAVAIGNGRIQWVEQQ